MRAIAKIEFSGQEKAGRAEKEAVLWGVRAALERLGPRVGWQVNVNLCAAEEIRKLNKAYRDEDRPTDVLSFSQGYWEDGRIMLGDLAICTEIAHGQARESGHSLGQELALLSLHGTLHLLGYDHHQGDPAMLGLQREIMESYPSQSG